MVGTLLIFWWALSATGDLTMARSIDMTQMVIFQFYHVFNCRSLHRSIFNISLFSNRFLFIAVITALLAQIAILYIPVLQALFETTAISLTHWAIILVVGTAIIWFVEIDKFLIRRRGMGPGLTLPEKIKRQSAVNRHFS